MAIALQIIIAILMLAITYEDFRYRAVHWVLFPIMALIIIAFNWWYPPAYNWMENALLNLFFIGFQIATITLFVSIKQRKLTNIFHNSFGLGDLLFLLTAALAFSFEGFLYFTIAALFTTVLITVLMQKISAKKWQRIPLAGCMAAFFIVNQCYTFFVL